MKQAILTAARFTWCFSLSLAVAEDKVVVIPLMDSSTSVVSGVPTVTSAGRVWLDRNLGALRVATKSADPDSYGTLYQWGRLGDGHEYRSSATIAAQSTADVPGHGRFIIGFEDWRNPANSNLWQGAAGVNNPCPAGFRLPTATEWESERASWSSNNTAGALASPLKLAAAGYRDNSSGGLTLIESRGYYWSSTVSSAVSGTRSSNLYFRSDTAATDTGIGLYRACGLSVRCIKD